MHAKIQNPGKVLIGKKLTPENREEERIEITVLMSMSGFFLQRGTVLGTSHQITETLEFAK